MTASAAIDSSLHRQIIETLVGDFERSGVPQPKAGVPGRVFACAWGLYAQIYRHARAAIVLTDAEMAQECHVLVRVALEHTILLHWVVERGNAGVDAMLNTQSKNMKKSIKTMNAASLTVPKEIDAEIKKIDLTMPEGEVLGQFRTICEQLDVLQLYFVYGIESVFVHPSIATINAYADDNGTLRTTPQPDIHKGNFAMLAYCLIWAGRDLDSLVEGHPAKVGLERLAGTIDCQPTLPPYSPPKKS